MHSEAISYSKIAACLGISENTIKSYCQRNNLGSMIADREGSIPRDTKIMAYSPTAEDFTRTYEYYSNNRYQYNVYFADSFFEDIFNIDALIYNPKNSDNLYALSIYQGEIAIMSSGMLSTAFSLDAVNKYVEDENISWVSRPGRDWRPAANCSHGQTDNL